MAKTTIPAGGITDGTLTSAKLDQDGAFTFNEDSADADFRVESNGEANIFAVNGGDDIVLLRKASNTSSASGTNGVLKIMTNDNAGGQMQLGSNDGGYSWIQASDGSSGYPICFQVSGGDVLVGKTSTGDTTQGVKLSAPGAASVFTSNDDNCIVTNRQTNDGSVISIKHANSQEGNIAVSGSTVAYNTFCGTHWSRLADNSKPTILRGTVMESISTLMDWYQVEYTKDSKTLTTYIGALPNGKKVGDSHTVTVNGVEETGVISKEDNERLPMCKISDTEDSKAVYGVFMDWDGDDDTVNDMYVASLGSFVVRIHKDQTVAIGDYLVSNGDGTAKKQADDILRSSTIAKVTSTEKTHTHGDGSYCVPCTLHCG